MIATISMLEKEKLVKLNYRKGNDGEFFFEPCSFPSIPMIEDGLLGAGDVKIIVIKTDDDNERADFNFKTFCEELEELSNRVGRKLEIDKIIRIPHEETREKQMQFYKELCLSYEEDCEIYMDITYGTKVTPIAMFSSLVYAEKVKNCKIENITYGKYAHNGGDIGNLYDVKSLYEIASIINTADYMSPDKIEVLVNSLWG